MREHFAKRFAPVAFVAVFVLPMTATAKADASDVTPEQVGDIAAEAYVYVYPLVIMDVTRRQMTNVSSDSAPGFSPMNTWYHFREYPDVNFKAVVRPNFDTLYSIAWLDLTEEPVIISVPDTQGRYYLLQMLDMWTDTFAVPGKRTSGTGPGIFAVTGPDWDGDLPEGVTRLRAPTPYVWVIGRVQTNGQADYEAVHKVQEGFKLTPLSAWGETAPPIKSKADPTIDMKTPPVRQVRDMLLADYFRYAADLMKVNPPHLTDGSMLLRMKRIGLEPGKSFDLNSLSPDIQKVVTDGAKVGQSMISQYAPKIAEEINGWQMNTRTMGIYGNSYLKRAVIAMIGLGANQQKDAVYPINIADASGNPIMGEGKYILHFDKGQLPPAEAFWSVTMYDAEGFPVANSIDRYAIGDRDALEYNADGSLDIYIQNESPGKDKESNWLPSGREGKMSVTMRIYAPRKEVLTGEWVPPAIKRVDK